MQSLLKLSSRAESRGISSLSITINTIFHLDLDTFFVSVERIFDPALEGKPEIVGTNPKKGREGVAACSYEARKFDLHSAMPIKKAYELCPHGIYIGGHHPASAKL